MSDIKISILLKSIGIKPDEVRIIKNNSDTRVILSENLKKNLKKLQKIAA